MYILFDIGGTKMRVVSADRKKFLAEPVIVNTPKDFGEGIETLKNIISNLSQGAPIEAIVGGVAGTFNVPVSIENDAALVGLGEANYGAGRDHNIVVYLTISTGVGGVRIVNGTIDESALGFEPGHQIIDPDNTLCPTCEGNDLEAYVSGTAIEKRFGKKPYEIHDDTVWDELAKYLAYGLANTTVHWSPNIIVLGGSMMKEVGIPVPAVKKHLTEILKIFPKIPEIKKAELADFGGLYGALSYARLKYY